MAVLIITFDVSSSYGIDVQKLVNAIKKYRWARLSPSSYAIVTDIPPEAVFSKLQPLLDESSNLYVMTLNKPFSGFGPQDVNDWLEQNLNSPRVLKTP